MNDSATDLGLFNHPYAAFLDRVEKPSRYTGSEHGSIRKDWASTEYRVCLAFPDVYEIGMSHLGYRILYQLLNADPRILAERCYAPGLDLREQLQTRHLPLVSLENARPLFEFDVVGFSLQFELCHTNLLMMLDLGRVPRRSTDRSDSDPLILGGGPAATHPEPVAPFFDAIVVGDGEEAFAEVALRWSADRRAGIPRPERLVRLAQLSGVYVPSLYETATDERTGLQTVQRSLREAPLPVRRRFVTDLSRFPFPATGPVGGPESVFDRMSVEVARGCTEGCRFCQAGMIYRPVRERPLEQIQSAVLSSICQSGQDEVSLTALSTADVSAIGPLITTLSAQLASERVSLAVASLRAYGLGPELLDSLRRMRASGLTFAPEAGSQRLRDVINKNITEDQLLETAQQVFRRGWDRMKLYFILGLPTETDEDLLAIVETARRTLAIGKPLTRGRATVTVSVSVHVPKPHTPFQWCEMQPLVEVERRQDLLRRSIRGLRGLSLRLHEAKASILEAIIARGDRRLADVIERAYDLGAIFDSWEDRFRSDLWDQAFAECGVDPAARLRALPIDATLPWSHIDVGLRRGFLKNEYRKALSGQTSPPCTKPIGLSRPHEALEAAERDERKLVCYACGHECNLDQVREARLARLRVLAPSVPNAVSSSCQTPAPSGPSAENSEQTDTPDPSTAEVTRDAPFGSTLDQGGKRALESEAVRQRWRLRYRKLGPAALLGHLDLIRELPRTLRRASLAVAYTRGFHPKPDLSFVTALSLGVPSLDEYVDVSLLNAPEGGELVERLTAASIEGLVFVDAVALPSGAPSLAKSIRAARYAIALAAADIAALGGDQALAQRVRAWLELPSSMVVRRIGDKAKSIDVRAFVQELSIETVAARSAIAQAGIVGAHTCLDVVVRIEPHGSAKSSEVVLALFPDTAPRSRAVRMALLTDQLVPLAGILREIAAKESGLAESKPVSAAD